MREAAADPRRGVRRPHHLLQEGVHSADASLPRQLRLLHLRPSAARRGEAAYLTPEQVLEIARAGQAAGCAEALFTLGDKPELKWKPAAEALAAMGYATTLDYLAAMGALVFKETGLLPHFNPGLMDAADLAKLRKSSVSMGIMLESTAERLGERGGAALRRARQGAGAAARDARRRRARRRCRSPRAS